MAYTLDQLAKLVGGEVVGNRDSTVSAVATLANAHDGQISFYINKHYREQLQKTRASAVILTKDAMKDCPVTAVVVKNPHAAYAKIAQLLYPEKQIEHARHPSAVIGAECSIDPKSYIGPNVVIGPGCIIEAGAFIGPNCTIGNQVKIGQDTRLVSNISIGKSVRIGRRTLIQPGAVIGADGFGQANEHGKWIKIPQVGSVIIGDDVEIGACTTIDCGAIEDTIVENGVKLDNQIQIAHNVRIGENTIIAGCTGIAGSTHISKNCMIGGAVGIIGHLHIAEGVTVTAMSLVTQDILEPGSSFSSGVPAVESQSWRRISVRLKQLDEIARQIRAIEQKLNS